MQESVPLRALSPDADSREPAFLDALAARAAEGDADAFEQIYSLLVDELYAFIRGQCHNETVAEDIMANVFLKAWRSIGRYNGGSDKFRRWMFAIARNEVRDHWRSSQRTLPFLDMDIGEETEPPSGTDPEDARRQVARAMSILTEEQRQVVVLRYFSNKSHEEIAAIMGKREGAVRALLLRALRRMRKAMADGELSARTA